jgi:hypothetical protein
MISEKSDILVPGSCILVRDEEPTSIISFTLHSSEYSSKLKNIPQDPNSEGTPMEKLHPMTDSEKKERIEDILRNRTGTHIKCGIWKPSLIDRILHQYSQVLVQSLFRGAF